MINRRKSVASILASFTATIDQLETLKNSELADNEKRIKEIARLDAEIDASSSEAARAESVATKLREIIR